jgi:hypothetical protein
MSPVGPAPIKRHFAPNGILILSIPWMAQLAGSTRVASSSVKLLILWHLEKSLTMSAQYSAEIAIRKQVQPIAQALRDVTTHKATYSANPPGSVQPCALRFRQNSGLPCLQ